MKSGPTPPGGTSSSETGGGAGGSAAGGGELRRFGGVEARPITPAYTPGRMAPNGADGSGTGDRGYAVSPNQPPVYPVGPTERTKLGTAKPN